MPTPTFQPPQGQQNTAQLQDWIIKLVRDLNYLLSCLDTVNINRLDANVIIANTITANKLNVTELSAISANLGTITAGSLTTNAEINVGTDATVGDNLTIGDAFSGADSVIYLNFAAFTVPSGSDSLGIVTPGLISIFSSSGDITLTTAGSQSVNINAPGGLCLNGSKGLAGTKTYYVSDTSTGVVTRKITFKDGLLISET